MDVKRSNYLETLPKFISSLSTCTSIAVDLEFTGITLPANPSTGRQPPGISRGDTPKTRYVRVLRKVVEEYAVVQVGISLMKEQPGEGGKTDLEVEVYNFYTFQSMEKGFSSSYPSAKLSLTSVNFLSGNGMDWNSWIRDGIPFMDEEGIKMERQRLDREYPSEMPGPGADPEPPRISLAREDDQLFLSQSLALVREWLDSALPAPPGEAESQSDSVLKLPPTNAFRRRVLYENIGYLYPDLVISGYGQGLDKGVMCERLTSAEKLARFTSSRQAALDHGTLRMGFGLVWEAVIRRCSGTSVPLVVHNGTYDLLFLTHNFGRRLGRYEDTWEYVSGCFPNVYDTKAMGAMKIKMDLTSNDPPTTPTTTTTTYDNSDLGTSYLWCVERGGGGKMTFKEGFEKYEKGEQLHEAAWDAAMTGAEGEGIRAAKASDVQRLGCRHIWLGDCVLGFFPDGKEEGQVREKIRKGLEKLGGVQKMERWPEYEARVGRDGEGKGEGGKEGGSSLWGMVKGWWKGENEERGNKRRRTVE
ncbi:hypothetical protein TrCOL_g4018 [Triparma columacea]|uniref:Uncharacterized protein n=1 Tax=Triparma columacea TaxID=722753 RepID=A0A9W7GHL3_9STRA|nr:hypothetical protein TrCOL_g4018 [Triparma columacea]